MSAESAKIRNCSLFMNNKSATDTGMAFVLIALLVAVIGSYREALYAAIGLQIVVMTVPQFFKPFAKYWFGLSTAMGTIVSKVILGVIFFALVTPVAMIRRAMNKDSLVLRQWKTGTQSVFCMRNHTYQQIDFKHPF